ncbi:MAG: EamA family transporter [Chloroflexi bacterium]|nr:EamA family transporter [Chloroflexota bacterium]
MALLVSYIVTALGQVIYKLFAHTRNKWHFLGAVAFFIIAPFTSYIALKRIEVGMVFIGAAFSQILIMLMSHYILRERITRDHLIATAFILLGLVMYAIG